MEKFAQAVLTLQPKRHDADYNPASRFRASGVLTDIDNARQGIEALRSAPRDQVRSLLAFLVFGVR
ncbi:MAG: hypothetical protein N2Z67_05830 [Acetobacteraceae bacterium]|nr:hypothetical protein [Acetobacteraceae bacterium]